MFVLRDHAVARHRLYSPDLRTLPPGGGLLAVVGDEAHHAVKVKRMAEGDAVDLTDAVGMAAQGVIESISKPRGEWTVSVRVTRVEAAPQIIPRVEVWAAPPKGDRLEQMIDQLGQVGAAAYAPLSTMRAVVEPREGKLQRLHRVALESAKQSGRAWAIEVLEGGDLTAALSGATGATVILADASGTPYHRSSAATVRVLVGPEGGWTPDELNNARASGAVVANFGPCVQRIETAAVTAAAIILNTERNP